MYWSRYVPWPCRSGLGVTHQALFAECCSSGRYCYGTGCCRLGDIGCEGNSCCSSRQTCCNGTSPPFSRPECSECSCSRFRWRVLQPRVSPFTWFTFASGSPFYLSTYCVDSNGVKGCCKNGRTCNNGVKDEAPVCALRGYVRCPGESFCCRKQPSPPRNRISLLSILTIV